MTRVIVSGCYDIIHAGHLQFFREARALGDSLTVCIAGDASLRQHKREHPLIPLDDRRVLLEALEVVDEVVVTSAGELGLDFAPYLSRGDVLAITTDDHYTVRKAMLCEAVGAKMVTLPKTPPPGVVEPQSTTSILKRIRAPQRVPLRVDFAGGWLDHPLHCQEGGFVVNCAVSPLVSLADWPYERQAGLGGSAAWAALRGDNPFEADTAAGNGWQDAAVITETGLCVWHSGHRSRLVLKTPGDWLRGHLDLVFTGCNHDTAAIAAGPKDTAAIIEAGRVAAAAVPAADITGLMEAVRMTYEVQLREGMQPLPQREGAVVKYCGSGHGGYALYLSATPSTFTVEPYYRSLTQERT